ncbi:hypothetical protein KCH_51010 [Kitasatospora cheerisanensis KCTC 2395]|uniref:Uncharacterized protein n=1 Tax=Kitasatospora cheerisanensis KCTC 2395 TaxID=1348663 RepID=A0A066YUF6_9ACTN|nr:hypothetical protein KCH_51010 [Kitasatospora cheerisanensis KCTC 2395]
MALPEHRGGDQKAFPLHGLGRTPAGVDERGHVKDGDAADHGVALCRGAGGAGRPGGRGALRGRARRGLAAVRRGVRCARRRGGRGGRGASGCAGCRGPDGGGPFRRGLARGARGALRGRCGRPPAGRRGARGRHRGLPGRRSVRGVVRRHRGLVPRVAVHAKLLPEIGGSSPGGRRRESTGRTAG